MPRRLTRKHIPILAFTAALFLLVAGAIYLANTSRPAAGAARGPLQLTAGQDKLALGPYMDILEDPSGQLTIEQVAALGAAADPGTAAPAGEFIPSQSDSPGFGFTRSVYWVRLPLENPSAQPIKRLLEVDFANSHYVDLYTPLPGGGYRARQSGVLRPVSTRDVLFPKIVFKLDIPANSTETIYLRFQNGASMSLGLTLWSGPAFDVFAQYFGFLRFLAFGAFLAILIYHILLLIAVRDLSYIYFTLLVGIVLVYDLFYSGYLVTYFFPAFYRSSTLLLLPLSFVLMFSAMILFSDQFLELRLRLPGFHRVHLALIAFGGLVALLLPVASYRSVAILGLPWALLSISIGLAAGVILWMRGYRSATLFMAAWMCMGIIIMIEILTRLGVGTSRWFSGNMYEAGLLVMALAWSMALADRINQLKASTESANRDLRHSEARLSQILEAMPHGVVLYGSDLKPRYTNQRTAEIISDSSRGLQIDRSYSRTLDQAIEYFGLKAAGSQADYPLEHFPVTHALQGQPATIDDIEILRGEQRIPLEVWASPVRDDAGNVEAAVLVFQDITYRRQAEAELAAYRKTLEQMVTQRTAELDTANKELRLRLEWMSAITSVAESMARSSEFSQIYDRIVEVVRRLFSVRHAFIAELEQSQTRYTLLVHSANSPDCDDLTGAPLVLPADLLPAAIPKLSGLEYLSGDRLNALGGVLGCHLQSAGVGELALAPLYLREQFFGFLGLEMHDSGRIITAEGANLLSVLSLDIAQLIEASRIYEQSRQLIAADERNRLARELHDSVTQVLFSATLVADVLPKIWRRNPERGLQSLENLRRLAHGALAEMRTMLLELRPSALVNTPLNELLSQLTEAITSRSALNFTLALQPVPVLPEEAQTTFYRIAQEALNNVVKHAQARHVLVELHMAPADTCSPDPAAQLITLVIQDNGQGFTPGQSGPAHLGLEIMHERAEAIGARLTLESKPGFGSRVSLAWCARQELSL